jgi:hypothetical protein
VQRLYESLPTVEDTEGIPGTRALVDAEIRRLLSGNITWEGQNRTYWTGNNLLPVGNHKIVTKKLDEDYYFWCAYGQVQFLARRGIISPSPQATKIVQNYFIVIHFRRGDAQAHVDYFLIGDVILRNNTQTLNRISEKATALLAQANRDAYETVKAKSEWTINNRTETGTFVQYRNGRVTLMRGHGRISFDVTRFSHNDQLLIRGYIDHQGIPARTQ